LQTGEESQCTRIPDIDMEVERPLVSRAEMGELLGRKANQAATHGGRSMTRLRLRWTLVGITAGLIALPASGAPPTLQLQDFLTAMQLSPKDVEAAKSGEIISGTAEASNERELVATMAFVVADVLPDQLVERGESGMLDEVDEQTIIFSILPENPTLESFAGLKLREDDVRDFARAKAGDRLNLSTEELEALAKLGKNPTASQVEAVVQAAMLARVQAYKAKGLAGIAPYQRSGGKERSAAEDLRTATKASHTIQGEVPDAFKLLLDYPAAIPAGTEETYRWSYIEAHAEPTIVLTHNLYIPEGESWIVVQRQFYVSRGYNCEQAIAAFIPVAEGTAVFYINRTSTDQVSGFGGGAKRSIGSKLLASQLKALYASAREAAVIE
jgi:hypothetical protein